MANLSKLAHLYFTIYRRNGSRYVPPRHYHNVQTMARSVIMSIAVCQHFGVDQYYIFQDSTDRLEQLFGRLRMLQRSNRNFDVVGLVDRILGIVSVQRFFDRNPRLDAGSRKLSGNITDHVNRCCSRWARRAGARVCRRPSIAARSKEFFK